MNLNREIKRLYELFMVYHHINSPLAHEDKSMYLSKEHDGFLYYGIFRRGNGVAPVSEMLKHNIGKDVYPYRADPIIRYRKDNLMLFNYIDDEFIKDCLE